MSVVHSFKPTKSLYALLVGVVTIASNYITAYLGATTAEASLAAGIAGAVTVYLSTQESAAPADTTTPAA